MKKKILMLCLLCLSLFVVTGCGEKKGEVKNTDATKFKEEYESLNDTIRESDGKLYNSVSIDEDNPIKYVSVKEALNVLKNDTAILYIGANWCPWCRNAVPVLFDVAKAHKVKTVYYLELDNDKDTFEIENGELMKTKEGSKEYYELLDFLSKELNDYIITDENGKKFNTNEKRVYMPFVVTVKNGKISSSHTGTVNLNDDQTKYSVLTTKQYDELYDIYDKMFEKTFSNNTCSSNGSCD